MTREIAKHLLEQVLDLTLCIAPGWASLEVVIRSRAGDGGSETSIGGEFRIK
jgi:hypothetical protein